MPSTEYQKRVIRGKIKTPDTGARRFDHTAALAHALLGTAKDAAKLPRAEAGALVAQEGQAAARAVKLVQVDGVDEQRFLEVRPTRQKLAVRVRDGAAAPEVQSVFEPDAVGMHHKRREQARIRLVDALYPARAGEPVALVQAAPRAGAVQKQHFRAIQPQQVRRRHVPEVLADQHADTPEARVKGAHAIAPRKVAPFIKKRVGRQIDIAMHMQDLTAAEIRLRDVEAMPRVFFFEPDQSALLMLHR